MSGITCQGNIFQDRVLNICPSTGILNNCFPIFSPIEIFYLCAMMHLSVSRAFISHRKLKTFLFLVLSHNTYPLCLHYKSINNVACILYPTTQTWNTYSNIIQAGHYRYKPRFVKVAHIFIFGHCKNNIQWPNCLCVENEFLVCCCYCIKAHNREILYNGLCFYCYDIGERKIVRV